MTLTCYILHRFELSSASHLLSLDPNLDHSIPLSSLYCIQISKPRHVLPTFVSDWCISLPFSASERFVYLLSQLHFQVPHLLHPRTIPTFLSCRRQSLYHPFQILKALLSNRMKHSKQPAKQEKKPKHAPLQSSLYFIQSHNSNRTGGAEAARTRGNHC